MKYKKVYLEWVDSCSSRGWNYMPDFKDDELIVKSIGFIMKESKKSIVISTSFTHYDSAMDPLTIPKCAIVKRRNFK